MHPLRAMPVVALCFAAGLLPSCQTRREPPPENAVAAGTLVPFAPLRARAPLQFETGLYPDLFTADSYALWVDTAVSLERMAEAEAAGDAPDAASTAEAEILDAAFQVIECHLDTLFPDAAIGFDAAALRGLDVYLETHDGRQIRPARMATGALTEGRQGALLQFSRPVLIGFARRDVPMVPASANSAAVRLVIEGHGSKFYFAWTAALPETFAEPRLIPPEKVAAAKMSFKSYYEKLRAWAHNFD